MGLSAVINLLSQIRNLKDLITNDAPVGQIESQISTILNTISDIRNNIIIRPQQRERWGFYTTSSDEDENITPLQRERWSLYIVEWSVTDAGEIYKSYLQSRNPAFKRYAIRLLDIAEIEASNLLI